MAVIVNWNGVDVPEELKALKRGRYVLVSIEEPPDLTDEQDTGFEAALASPHTLSGTTEGTSLHGNPINRQFASVIPSSDTHCTGEFRPPR